MEQFVQLLISIIALFSSIILIFNGCTSSKPDIIKNEKKLENTNKKSPRNLVEEKKDEEQEQDTIIKAKYVKETTNNNKKESVDSISESRYEEEIIEKNNNNLKSCMTYSKEEKEELESLDDNLSSKSSVSSMSLHVESKNSTNCAKLNKKSPLKLQMKFKEWDLDLEISGDEEEKKKEEIKKVEPKTNQKPIKLQVDEEEKKFLIKKNNVLNKPSFKVQMNFNDWNSELKID